MPLTIKANDLEKKQNENDPVFTVTYTGFVPGDDSTVVKDLTINRVHGEIPGKYSITPSAGSAPNYIISFENGILTIEGVTSVLRDKSSNKTKINCSVKGIFIRSNPVYLSSPKADFRIVTNAPSDLRIIIYDAVGNAVFDENKSSYTGTVDMSWNLYTKSGHRAYYGTYLIVAKTKNRFDGSTELLTAKLGLKQK